MIGITNLSHMTILGWRKRYSQILDEFGYNEKNDIESAKILNSLLKNIFPLRKLREKIEDQNVFVIGAGPSLLSSIPILKKYNSATKIAADGAVKALIDNNIIPDILVTDLDGDETSLKKIGKGKTIMIVHAHGDNFQKLGMVKKFINCIGTTETKSFGKINNFGGFTDGDRCVFLARHFGAKKIILFGMDFGNKIGMYSKEKIPNRLTKIKKLRRGKKLLEWLASKNSLGLYTTSKPILGFKKIRYNELQSIFGD
jgi:2-amino-4-hydroxy-6-hydroxymethyldihydropteridine diphosphokinase